MDIWDVIIVGAGSAGNAAAIYAVRSGLKTLVLDEKFAGGAIADSPKIVNYPGFAEISGSELAMKMSDHARTLGAEVHDIEAVTGLDLKDDIKTVTTPSGSYQTKAVILATGSHYKEIGAKGEKEFRGRGVSYCGVCDGPFFKMKRVMVVGGGNSSLHNFTIPFRFGLGGLGGTQAEYVPCRRASGKRHSHKSQHQNHLEHRD